MACPDHTLAEILTSRGMPPGTSQARMMTLAAKTDSPLPLLFGWAVNRRDSPGLQLASQIQWGALRELFCSPSYPLVMSVGTDTTLGKSYLLQYLYALQECHFRGPQNPLRIHSMPSIDIIGDFAREECMRGVTLADVHSFSQSDPLCEALTATLQSFTTLTLLHASLKIDFQADGRPKPGLQQLLSVLSAAENTSFSLLLLLRDAEDDHGPSEQRRVVASVESVAKSLRPEVLRSIEDVWGVVSDAFGKFRANRADQRSEITQEEPWNISCHFAMGRRFVTGRGVSRGAQVQKEIPPHASASVMLRTIRRTFCSEWPEAVGRKGEAGEAGEGTWTRCVGTTRVDRVGPRCFMWRSSWEAFSSGSESSTTHCADPR